MNTRYIAGLAEKDKSVIIVSIFDRKTNIFVSTIECYPDFVTVLAESLKDTTWIIHGLQTMIGTERRRKKTEL